MGPEGVCIIPSLAIGVGAPAIGAFDVVVVVAIGDGVGDGTPFCSCDSAAGWLGEDIVWI